MERIPTAIGFAIGMMIVGIVFGLFEIASFAGAIIGGLTGGVAYFILGKLFESMDLRILAHVDHRFWKRLITHSGLS